MNTKPDKRQILVACTHLLAVLVLIATLAPAAATEIDDIW